MSSKSARNMQKSHETKQNMSVVENIKTKRRLVVPKNATSATLENKSTVVSEVPSNSNQQTGNQQTSSNQQPSSNQQTGNQQTGRRGVKNQLVRKNQTKEPQSKKPRVVSTKTRLQNNTSVEQQQDASSNSGTKPSQASSRRKASDRSKTPATDKETPSQNKSSKKPNSRTSRAQSVPKPSSKKNTVVTKVKRPYNTKKAPIDYAGIGIGPAKVKKVLMHVSFNPLEHATRQALKEAEKPSVPKPTVENPNPVQPAQTPVSQLSAQYLEVINKAETDHMSVLRNEYEASYLSNLRNSNKDKYNDYIKARSEASYKENFSLQGFNSTFDPSYYDNFEKFCQEEDNYSLNRTGDKKFNQWSRAMVLVNKMCIRLSSGVRDVLAAFLDHIVIQYAKNGIYNCVEQNLSNLKLRHALLRNANFKTIVPLDKLIRTFENYESGLEWIQACQKVKEQVIERRESLKKEKVKSENMASVVPAYPDPGYEENFEGYVVEICRSVKVQLAEEQKNASDKAKYLNVKISDDFKKFCSNIVYETILRVGKHLKETIALKDVKTVNRPLMMYSLRQLCNICCVDFTEMENDITNRLTKFKSWCEERRKNRGKQKTEHKSDSLNQQGQEQLEADETVELVDEAVELVEEDAEEDQDQADEDQDDAENETTELNYEDEDEDE
jgi:hypothetical protein